MPKLTETFAAKLALPESGTRKYWDTEVKGFGLFAGKRSKTWYYQRDVGGRTRRILIGRHPVISAAAARQAAQTLALDMSRGAGKVFQTGAPTLQQAMTAYLSRPKLRSEAFKATVRSGLNNHLRDWLRLPLDEITRSMVVARHGQLAHIPSGANHIFRAFRSIWNHARRTSDLPEPPTLAIEWYDEQPDGRIIDDLIKWRATVDALENPIHAACYRLLLFTGLRKSEAAALRWRDVHEDRIHIPVHHGPSPEPEAYPLVTPCTPAHIRDGRHGGRGHRGDRRAASQPHAPFDHWAPLRSPLARGLAASDGDGFH
jgi:integrase